MENTREKVAAVIKTLRKSGIACHLFGGWAEELLGLHEPSQHGDIDLLHCGENFEQFDGVLKTFPEFAEVPAALEVPLEIEGVLSLDIVIADKGEAVANERTASEAHADRELTVVRVPQSHDVGIARVVALEA